MGMVLFFVLIIYVALVILPAGVAVLLLLWKSFQSPRFWASGAFLTTVALVVLPKLRPSSDSITRTVLGASIDTFISTISSQVSIGLGVAAMISLAFSLITFYKKQWDLLKGLSLGICAATWIWLVLMFRPV